MFWDVKKTGALKQRLRATASFFCRTIITSTGTTPLLGPKDTPLKDHSISIKKGAIVGWDEDNEQQARKTGSTEAERLRTSFESAKSAGF